MHESESLSDLHSTACFLGMSKYVIRVILEAMQYILLDNLKLSEVQEAIVQQV